MPRLIGTAFAALVIFLSAPLWAQGFEEELRDLRPLAEQGDVAAQTRLGEMYRDDASSNKINGEYGTDDEAEAEAYFRAAESSYHEAAKWYRMAADQGNAEAQTELGHIYYEFEDYAAALSWFHKAAETGFAEAQTTLGVVYRDGDILTPDYDTALQWFHLAANQGEPGAQVELAHMYWEGWGVAQDYVLAHMWSSRAGEIELRDEIALDMTPAQIAEAEKRARE